MTGTQVDRSLPKTGFLFPWPFPNGAPSFIYRMKNYAALLMVRCASRLLFFGGVNQLNVKGRERFVTALQNRSRPLITITNHRSNLDDPLMWTILTWKEFFQTIDRQRYTLTAHNICFSKQWHTTIFSLGNCVPCVRGEGVFQKGMDFSLEKLNKNGWVHIFPEGRVTETPLRFKWGVGRLIMEPDVAPIVLPIWMRGMETVWPNHPPYYPKFGKKISLTVGEPLDTQELRAEISKDPNMSERQRRKLMTDRVQELLFSLGEECGDLEKGLTERLRKEHERHIDEFR
ncbi:unnamed protein product, partial [Mesorhabditis spiculigera]